MRRLALFAIALLAVAAALIALFTKNKSQPVDYVLNSNTISDFCGKCHALPQPNTLSKADWPEQINLMVSLVQPESWPPNTLPSPDQVTNYYTQRAPEQLTIRLASNQADSTGFQFDRVGLWYLPEDTGFGSVTHVQFAPLTGTADRALLVCDGRYGLVLAGMPGQSDRLRVLGAVPQPCHVQVVDLDRDGILDVLVASLGEFGPTDARKGAVYWLKGNGRGGYETIELIAELGRVSDVRAADFDSDGDLDLIVAEFGWRKVGKIIYGENVTRDEEVPQFELYSIDARRGAVHIPVVDLNEDGHTDFVALFSQEYESVVAFINDGTGRFSAQTIFDARNPAWGSSGMEIVDLDSDGKLDILLSNGDTFDNFILKPYHGISWLRNRGELNFTHHPIADMPATYNAKAADLDGDGDLDIVACAFYAPPPGRHQVSPESLETLIWLEQRGPGEFERHVLESGECVYLSLDAHDYDGDGKIDIVAGVWPSGQYQSDRSRTWEWVRLFRNVTGDR